MVKSGSAAVMALALVCGLAAGGCSTQQPMGAHRGSASSVEGQQSADVKSRTDAPNFISERELGQRALKSLWTKQNTEGAFRSAYLLPEGIFAVTRPQAGRGAVRLVRYKLDDGLPLWLYDLDDRLEYPPVAYRYRSSPDTSHSDELFILQKDVVRCLDLEHGAEMWRVQLPFPVSCAPIVDEKQYYIGSYDRRIYAMRKKQSDVEWAYITGGEIKSPGAIGQGGQLYFTSTDNSIFRLEPNGGYMPGKSWQFATGGRIQGSPVFFSRWVFTGSADFKLYSFEVDGTRSWEFPVQAPIPETPVVMSFRPDKPLVFCISQEDRRGDPQRTLWVLDARTGSELWRRPDISQVISLGRRAAYLLPTSRSGRDGAARRIIAVDPLKGHELHSLPADFEIIPQNHADHGMDARARGVIYLISQSGHMQAIREKP